jgi:hypothetical protein
MASVGTIYGFCSLAMFYARVANASAFVDTYKVMHPHPIFLEILQKDLQLIDILSTWTLSYHLKP